MMTCGQTSRERDSEGVVYQMKTHLLEQVPLRTRFRQNKSVVELHLMTETLY